MWRRSQFPPAIVSHKQRARVMKTKYKWRFKSRFRRGAYGWRGTALASKRLREAVSEIKKVNRSDPVLAAEGAVTLMERVWPALQGIDGSSGALGNAVNRTIDALTPILADAPADIETRRELLERLHRAVQEDGVEFLSNAEEHWGELCVFPELVNEWVDRLLPGLKECWENRRPGDFFIGTSACLSCLLEAGRYDELEDILSLRNLRFWPYNKYQAEALRRRGRIDEAIGYAESRLGNEYERQKILEFCEATLLGAGRKNEAYRRYATSIRVGNTYLAQHRAIVKKYPERDPREILLDLMESSDNRGAWFASAHRSGFMDIAKECATSGYVEPGTLVRAARDTAESQPELAAAVALRAIGLLLQGYGQEETTSDTTAAFDYLITAANNANATPWAVSELSRLLDRQPPNYDQVSENVLRGMLNRSLETAPPDQTGDQRWPMSGSPV